MTDEQREAVTLGAWRWPPAARKAHFFPIATDSGLRSACNGWLYAGPTDGTSIGSKPGHDDCVACWRWVNKALAAV